MYKVLLVDDDRFVRLDFKKFRHWEEYGFCIAGEAEDGYAALQKTREESFDLAFVDIRMPRIDGLGFLSELKEVKENLCVILVSGYTDFEYARQGFKLGAFDYLIKPVEEAGLCSLLASSRKHLDELNAQKADLKLPYTLEEENRVVEAMNSGPEALRLAAERLTRKIARFCGDDSFRFATLLSGSRKNVLEKLLRKKPYLSQIYSIEPFPEALYTADDPGGAAAWFLEDLSALAEKVSGLAPNGDNLAVRLFCDYVLNHLCEGISLKSAAAGIGYNSKYLSRVFREKAGETCLAYMTRLKMQRAASLLLSGKYRMYEISGILGYKSPEYFCSLFKKHYGVTPSEYQTAFQA